MTTDLYGRAIRLAHQQPSMRSALLKVLRIARTDKYAAANTLTIVESFLKTDWPAVKKAIADKDYDEAKRKAEIIQSAYFYAPGMNEAVVDYEGTREATFAISPLIRALAAGDEEKIAVWAKEMDSKAVEEGKQVLKDYRWQKGMHGDQIMREGRPVLNQAASMGTKVWKAVSKVYYSKGIEAAKKELEKHLKP